MKYLLIDDIRTFDVDKIARTAEEGKKELSTKQYDVVTLDHDLGNGETGYDVLCWAIENNCLPKKVILCSMNPIGKKAMANKLRDIGYTSRTSVSSYFVKK